MHHKGGPCSDHFYSAWLGSILHLLLSYHISSSCRYPSFHPGPLTSYLNPWLWQRYPAWKVFPISAERTSAAGFKPLPRNRKASILPQTYFQSVSSAIIQIGHRKTRFHANIPWMFAWKHSNWMFEWNEMRLKWRISFHWNEMKWDASCISFQETEMRYVWNEMTEMRLKWLKRDASCVDLCQCYPTCAWVRCAHWQTLL